MTERGFVRLYRKLLDDSLIQDHWLFTLWCWCLLKASHREWRGLQPGQFRTGRSTGSEELGVSPSKFYRGLQKLAEQHYIALEANSSWTTVTICNWKAYQGDTKPERTADEQQVDSKWTADEQQMNSKWTADEHITITETQKNKIINTPLTPQGATGLERPPVADASQGDPPGEPLDPTGRTDWRQPEPSRRPPRVDPVWVLQEFDLDTPTFRPVWVRWCDHMTERAGRPPSRQTMAKQLERVKQHGEAAAIAAIEEAITNNWQGTLKIEQHATAAKQPARTPFMGLTEDDLRDFR